MNWLILGNGDIGRRVARRVLAEGGSATICSRTDDKIPKGCQFLAVDLDQTIPALPPADYLIYTIPPPRETKIDERIRRLLASLGAGGPANFVYLSTSGVYGDCAGDWVDETRPPSPRTDRAQRRLDAEQQVQTWAQSRGCGYSILRVPGIYGPGRWPLKRLAAGTPIVRASEAPWSNRIHADDLARACLLAAKKGRGLYNISDGQPGCMSEYFLAVARAFGFPAPPEIGLDQAAEILNPMQLSFLAESRRLDIAKARSELGYRPVYPQLTIDPNTEKSGA